MENDNNTNGSNTTPAHNPAGAKTPLVKRVKIPTVRPGTPPQPAAAPVQNPAVETAPSARVEAGHSETKEPDLPPENKKEVVPQAIEADEIEKAPVRKKRRGSSSAGGAASALDETAKKKAEEQLHKAKAKAKSFLSNKWNRLGILVVLLGIICFGVYSSLPIIAEKKLPAIFAANGMPFKTFKIKQITIDTMELTNVSDKTGTMTISSMKFNYSLFSLFSSNIIRSMELTGVNINGEKKSDGISLGALGGLIYSPVNAQKGKEITINSLQVKNGRFILKNDAPPEKIVNEYGEEEEVDNTIVINFTANGTLSKTGLNMQISTDYASPQMAVKTQTALNKTAMSSQIKTEITEGNLLKDSNNVGSVSGNLEISVNNGVLSKGQADLLLSSSSQKLKLQADVTPKDDSFDIAVNLDRSFENPHDAVGKFVGSLALQANDVTVKGTFQNFEGTLPLQMNAPSLTTGKLAVQDLKTDMSVKFSCSGSACTATLTKPMKFSFTSLQSAGSFRHIKLFTPLELTINPDQNDPFLRSDGGKLSFTLPISAFSTQIFIADNISSTQIATAINGLKARAQYNIFSGNYSGDATFVQSGFASKDIKMTGIQGIASFTSQTLPDVRLRIAKAALTQPDVMPEFSADLRFRPMSPVEFGVDSTLSIQNGLVTATINGSYTLPTHEWNMYVVVPKFILSESGLHLENVMPFMLKHLPESTLGGLAAKGRLTIKNGKVAGPIDVLMENVETTWNGMGIEALNGVLTLSSILPLETPENQQLFIGTLNVGIPFQNALFNFRIQANRGIEVANARMKYANGQFKTIKSFFIPYEGQTSQILFEGSGIDLSSVTNNLKSSALRIDGVMNSEWFLSYADKKLNINNAKFTSKLPGTLHFSPSEELGKKMDPQMLAFLKDVIVRNMTVTAKGQIDGQVSFDVFIEGHSPLETEANDQDVSFDFKGSFKNFLKQEGGLLEIPSDILLSLQEFSKK